MDSVTLQERLTAKQYAAHLALDRQYAEFDYADMVRGRAKRERDEAEFEGWLGSVKPVYSVDKIAKMKKLNRCTVMKIAERFKLNLTVRVMNRILTGDI
jgi:hypothetical protein